VECNKRFAYSAETTLNLIQSLYEKKITTYPRVDTQFLPDDVYPKCPSIMNGLYKTTFGNTQPYAQIVKALGGKPLPKTKKVFDSSKVTDHHAIIPTGVPPVALTDMERHVFDLVAKRFIAAFYPDCKFSTTTVMGEVSNELTNETVEFKATGKEILSPGWRVVYESDVKVVDEDEAKKDNEERTLPTFTKGESGPHQPTLTEKWTTPPKPYTEATLLRAMETAGKFVEDEELRAALKENGIGRPSSRAGIIETLFKRHYIRRERKNLIATPTGIELIDTIKEELLKSCELTGIWEKKLRDIEHQKYDAALFVDELKQQITTIVNDVMRENTTKHITLTTEDDVKAKKPKRQTNKKETLKPSDNIIGKPCPVCGKGTIIKGKTAYGCSNWQRCDFRLPFDK
jgi:DNA topoisomerase-3